MFQWFFDSVEWFFLSATCQSKFLKKCQSVISAEDIFQIAREYQDLWKSGQYWQREIFNRELGWALPTLETCSHIFSFWSQHPHTIVDLGAGSGMFCRALNGMGIPAEQLFAVDLVNPTHGTYSKLLWPIWTDEYDFSTEDILFIAWGIGDLEPILTKYIKDGGNYVIILGESECTFPCDYFEDKPDWDMKLIHVAGPASSISEHLSFNTRKNTSKLKNEL